MIVIVALVGAYRQSGYGNVRLREALSSAPSRRSACWSGSSIANNVSERALQLSFAALALFIASQLVRRARSSEPPARSWPCASGHRVRSKRGFADLGGRPAAAALADPGLRVPRLERRRRRRLDGARRGRRVARRRADRPGRPRGVLRLPGDPADDHASPKARPASIEWPREQPARRPRPGRRPRPRPARRHRAEPALAHLLGDDRDRRRRARRRDGDHAGRPDRRGLPHPAGADHRPRLQRGAGRGARPRALQLRGADRDRRRRPRLLPPGRA